MGKATGVNQSEILVNMIGNKRNKRSQCSAKDCEHFKNNRENDDLSILSIFAFAAVATHPQVPIGKIVHEREQTRDHRIQTVGGHFFANESEEASHGSLYPLVEQVL